MIVKYVTDMLIQSGAFGGRVYPDDLPPAPDYPAAVVTLITQPRSYDMSGDVGVKEARVQVDIYALKSYTTLVDLATAAGDLFSGFKSGIDSSPCAIQGMFVINETDLDVAETLKTGPKLRRRMLEIRIWSKLNG